MRSAERIRDLGEVFTPEAIVDSMLELLQDINYASKFLEPGCGNGNFLEKILSSKLEIVSRLPEVKNSLRSGNLDEFEFKTIIALSSIYGIDIDSLNISEAKERLIALLISWYTKLSKNAPSENFLNNVESVLDKNIILGDLIAAPGKIEIYQYSELPSQRIKRRVFLFTQLIFPEDEVFEDNDMLFGHVPNQLRDYPPISYKELGIVGA
jgi:hypothetical protein